MAQLPKIAQNWPKIAQIGPKMTQNGPKTSTSWKNSTDISAASATFCISANLYFGSIQYSWGTWLVVGDPPFLPLSFFLLFVIRLCLTGTWRRGEKKRFYENQRQNVRDFENSYQRRKNITKRDKKRKSEDLMWTKHAVCQKLFWINHVHLKDRIHSRQIYFQIYVIIITLE